MGKRDHKNGHENKSSSNHDWKQPTKEHFSLMQENYYKWKTFCRMILNWVIHNNARVSWPVRESWHVCIFWTIYNNLII